MLIMANNVIKNVQTQAVGFAPILRSYFDKCAIAEIIDDHVELDPLCVRIVVGLNET